LTLRYLNDWIWLRLSNRYGVTHATHSVTDVYDRWMGEVDDGNPGVDLVDYYFDRVPDADTLNDAEYMYWSGNGVLDDAVLWLDAYAVSESATKIPNLGWGGSVLDAQRGDGSTASTYPTLLTHTGENYLYLPGIGANSVTFPDSDALDVDSFEIIARIALDDWGNAVVNQAVVTKYTNTTSGGIAQRTYMVRINDRYLILDYILGSNTSTVLQANTQAGFLDATTLPNGSYGWVKITRDSATGTIEFYKAADTGSPTVLPPSWTKATTSGTQTAGALYVTNATTNIGSFSESGSSYPLAGKVSRVIINNAASAGTTVLDTNMAVDLFDGDQTSFTATSGQTGTILRATSGRKSVVVTRPVVLFGLDDYWDVPDNDLLDFGATDSFTVMVVNRTWGTISNNSVAGKGTSIAATMTGYQMFFSVGVPSYRFGDGTNRVGGLGAPTPVSGQLRTLSMHRDVSLDRAWATTDGVLSGSTTVDTTTGSLANSDTFRVGGSVSLGYSDMELFAVAVWRRALTADEIAAVAQFYEVTTSPGWEQFVQLENGIPVLDEFGLPIELENGTQNLLYMFRFQLEDDTWLLDESNDFVEFEVI